MNFNDVIQEAQQTNTPSDIKPIKQQIHRYYLKDPSDLYFTTREFQCMPFLIANKKSEEIAELMQLSKRTIEFYIKSMKMKTGVNTKEALIKKLIQIQNRFIKTEMRDPGVS